MCLHCGDEMTWVGLLVEIREAHSHKLETLQAVAKLAHHFVMKGHWRPGGIQAIARALAAAGYDMGQLEGR
jgi:hypothetical protein